jgi:uncharacterized membrane protein HdeD (DUF308 family)
MARAALAFMESKVWYGVLGRGVVALLFAMFAIANPHPWMSAGRLAKLFAGYAIIDSALSAFVAVRTHATHEAQKSGLVALEAALSAALGIVALAVPSVLALRVIGGLRAVVVGASDVLWARRGNVDDLVEMGGIVAIVLGGILLAWPGPATVALPWLLGLAALVSGGLLFAGALSKLRAQLVLEGRI